MFYKNVQFIFPVILFGFYSVFSGTTIYDIFLYQTFNVFFTGAPILWFGIMDIKISRHKFLKDSKYYRIGFNGKFKLCL